MTKKFYAMFAVLVCLVRWLPTGARPEGRLPPTGDEPLALTCYYHGDFKQAAAEYGRLALREPERQVLAKSCAASLLEAGQAKNALSVLKRAKVRGNELAETALAAGDFSLAMGELEFSLQSPGDHGRSYFLLGYIHYLQGDPAEAAHLFWRSQEVSPPQGTVHLFLGRSFQRLAEGSSREQDYFFSRANEEYAKALKLDPSLWPAHRDMALVAEQTRQWSTAWTQWQRVKGILGATSETTAALSRVHASLPTPTSTPSPAAVIMTAMPPAPMFKAVTVDLLPPSPEEPLIRVGLGKDLSSLAFGCVGEWRALDQKGRVLWSGQAQTGYRLGQDTNGQWALKNWEGRVLKHFRKKIILEPALPQKVLAVIRLYQTAGYSWSLGDRKTRYYRGRLEIRFHRRTLDVINRVPLEDYLLSLVPGEMESEWPLEGLKTQAIVSRTDTLRRRDNHGRDGFDVCNNVHCAYYPGVESENPHTYQAVYETLGLVLVKDGLLCPTFYSHNCGGITQSWEDAWGKTALDPCQPQGVYDAAGDSGTVKALPLAPGEIGSWLAGSPGVFCNAPEYSAYRNFRWFKILTRQEATDLLDARFGVGQVESIRVLERSSSAFVRSLLVVGARGQAVVRGDAIRSSLGGMRSNLFTILPVPEAGSDTPSVQAWLITGGGWGHGVGMCQVGVGEMARRGYTDHVILNHYFPKGEIQAWKYFSGK